MEKASWNTAEILTQELTEKQLLDTLDHSYKEKKMKSLSQINQRTKTLISLNIVLYHWHDIDKMYEVKKRRKSTEEATVRKLDNSTKIAKMSNCGDQWKHCQQIFKEKISKTKETEMGRKTTLWIFQVTN